MENKDRLSNVEGGFMASGSREWKAMDEEKKKGYVEKHKLMKETYEKEMQEYNLKLKAFKDAGGEIPKTESKEYAVHGQLPLSRIKAIIKLDPENTNVAKSATQIIAKAAEIFCKSLASRVYETQTRPQGTKTIKEKHIASCVHRERRFRFLDSDFSLHDPTKRKKQKTTTTTKKPIETYGTQNINKFFQNPGAM